MRRLSLLLLLSSMSGGSVFAAAEGDLDPTFSGDGRQTVPFDRAVPLRDVGRATVELPGGKLLVIGDVSPFLFPTGLLLGCTRLNADGELDTTYGTNGLKTLQTEIYAWSATAVDTADRIAIVGQHYTNEGGSETDTNFRVEMIDANCERVTTFGAGGVAEIDFDLGGNLQDVPTAAAWGGSPRRLYVVGDVPRTSPDVDIGIAAFEANGQPSMAFGGGTGWVVHFFDVAAPYVDSPSDLAIVGGKVLVAGRTSAPGDRFVTALLRVDATTGVPDPTFCDVGQCNASFVMQPGYRTFDIDTSLTQSSQRVAVAPDGTSWVVGTVRAATNTGSTQLSVVKFFPFGTRDESHPTVGGGIDVHTRPRFASWTSAGLVIAGETAALPFLFDVEDGSRMFIGRTNLATGAPDGSFASASCNTSPARWCTTIDFPPSSAAHPTNVRLHGLTRLASGQYVLTGKRMYQSTSTTRDDDFAIARTAATLRFANGFE